MGAVCAGINAKIEEVKKKQEEHNNRHKCKFEAKVGEVYFHTAQRCMYVVSKVIDPEKVEYYEFDDESKNSDDSWPWDYRWMELKDTLIGAYAPTFQVTADYRGAKVNGIATDFEEETKKIKVSFKPDPAHQKYDKTDSRLGKHEFYVTSELTPGHTGAERPRNRNATEKNAERDRLKSYGVTFIHCGSCGIGMWEDPCDCYVNHKRKGWYCQECGKQASSGSRVCCGRKVADGAQNQGWAKVLYNMYGRKEPV